MGKYKVEKSSGNSGIIPDGMKVPEDTYFFDLIWIEEMQGKNGASFRWTFKFSDIDSQKKVLIDGEEVDISKFQVSALTPTIPTLNNKFGGFLKVLYGEINLGDDGDTLDLIKARFRVKGFLVHKESGDKVFHNLDKMIDGTMEKGVGIGVDGIPNWMIEKVNIVLAKEGAPLLQKKEFKEGNDEVDSNTETKNQEEKKTTTKTTKKQDIGW